jgi:hypothetical protein
MSQETNMPNWRLRLLLAAALLAWLAVASALAAVPAAAQERAPPGVTIQPIYMVEEKDHPGCLIYLKPDGTRLYFKGKPVSVYGPCPPEFARGLVTRFGDFTYKLEIEGQTCIMTPWGMGRCEEGGSIP